MSKNKKPFKVEIAPASTQHHNVKINIEYAGFLKGLETLTTEEQDRVFATLKKITQMTWDEVYKTASKTPGQKRGINFEPIDQWTKSGIRIATIRLTQKMRARVCRRGQFMIFLSIHPDHDSAYKGTGGEDV